VAERPLNYPGSLSLGCGDLLSIFGSPLLPIGSYETGNGSVITPLHLRRKETSGKLSQPPMIGYALTAFAFLVAWFIGTGTLCLVQLQIAFGHGPFLLSIIAASLRAHM
jgi:hypothetical protein